jgi:hypothetical protein
VKTVENRVATYFPALTWLKSGIVTAAVGQRNPQGADPQQNPGDGVLLD